MNRNRTILQAIASIFMIVTLLWLSVSTPFVYAAQKDLKAAPAQKHLSDKSADDDGNPFSSTTEEKSENGNSLISEYLHDPFEHERNFTIISTFYKCHPDDLYFAFHPELLSPPPEV